MKRFIVLALIVAFALVVACSASKGSGGTARDGGSDARLVDANGGEGSVGPPEDGGADDGAASPDGHPVICPPSTSYQSDPHNCGTCKHDCLGGGCLAGHCSPYVLQLDDAGAQGGWPACGPSGMYWAFVGTPGSPDGGGANYTDGYVAYLPDDAGPTSASPSAGSPQRVTTDGTNLYVLMGGTFADGAWVGDGQLVQCVGSICSATVQVLAQGVPSSAPILATSELSIAAGPSDVFWTGRGSSGIWETPIDGGTTASFESGTPVYMATTATDLYWFAGGVLRAPLTGGSPVTLAASGSTASGLIVDANDVYVILTDPGGTTAPYLASCALPDCSAGLQKVETNLTTSPSYVAGALTQDTSDNLYWMAQTAPERFAVVTCAKASCTPSVVAASAFMGDGLCVTPTVFSWAGAGGVARLAR